MPADERTLTELATEEPTVVIAYLAHLNENGALDTERLLNVALAFFEQDVNLIQLLIDHPEETEAALGIDVDELAGHVEAFEPA